MKCPDCNGGIEGAPAFCPHCGRTFDGGLLALGNRLFTTARQGEDRFAASWEKHRSASPTQSLPAIPRRLLLIAIATLAGGAIGHWVIGGSGLAGAFVGFFLSLPKKKKS